MSKIKTFISGALFGCFLLTGVAFATDQIQITVNVPDVSYVLDGQPLQSMSEEIDADLPPALEFRGVLYAPLPLLAEASATKWEWDQQEQTVRLTSPTVAGFAVIPWEDTPSTLLGWVEQSLEKQHAQSRLVGGDTYILITRGIKNTGGYDVTIEHIEEIDGRLKVYADWSDPSKGELVTQSITHPYVLAKVEGKYNEVDFVHRSRKTSDSQD